MDGRSLSNIPVIATHKSASPRFFKTKIALASDFISRNLQIIYSSLKSIVQIDYQKIFKENVWFCIYTSLSYALGEYLTVNLSKNFYDNEEYDFVFKFLLGSAVLGYSAMHRITEQNEKSKMQYTAEISRELLSILYLYSSSFKGSQLVFSRILPQDYTLLASLGVSIFGVPGLFSFLAKKYQELATHSLCSQGAQRSDTSAIIGGLTPVANIYMQLNYFMFKEILTPSRLFQLEVIGDNVLNLKTLFQKIRNLPALLADIGQPIYAKYIENKTNIKVDYQHNMTSHQVLRFINSSPVFSTKKRFELRTGDLVFCDEKFNLKNAPISGEIIALEKNEQKEFTPQQMKSKFKVNLQSKNGEDIWIEYQTLTKETNDYKKIDLAHVREGRQPAVLAGVKVDFLNNKNFFVRVKPEFESIRTNDYEQTSVIEEIISFDKDKKVGYAIAFAFLFSGLAYRDFSNIVGDSVYVMNNLANMMVPFALTFLRDRVNNRLLKDINQYLPDTPLKTIDALRIVDLFNGLSGYYKKIFPGEVVIVSDKTGTLTTPKMDVLGFWTADMSSDVQAVLSDEKSHFEEMKNQQAACFEIFCQAHTHQRKELEPEEFSILDYFKKIADEKNHLEVESIKNNHFRKTISVAGNKKVIETMHLGLFTKFGGRLTLVVEGDKKYFVFCGVPRQSEFANTDLLNAYQKMTMRTGVLTRDWCIAQAILSEADFNQLKYFYENEKSKDIENYLVSHPAIFKSLKHCCTFLINNPVKKDAEKFIERCRSINVPVFIATGDTAKAAMNIAKVLNPNGANRITIVKNNQNDLNIHDLQADSTLVFAGLNQEILILFSQIMKIDIQRRPTVIFSEMSTAGKGELAGYLKKLGCFVVANGDGSNDIAMMKEAHLVLAHLTEEGKYAPGIEKLVNLNDRQLQAILRSDKSFYELFDIHLSNSQLKKLFSPLKNSQEKPSLALTLKASKMTFELAKTAEVANLIEMPQQHYKGLFFDLTFLAESYYSITSSVDCPLDDKNLVESNLSMRTLFSTLSTAILQALITYRLSKETTNEYWMILMLIFTPFVFNRIFAAKPSEASIEKSSVKIEEIEEKTVPRLR